MWSWLEAPLLVAMLAVLSTGVAMLLSSLYVYLRDMQPIWEVLTQILFYASPVIVPVSTVEARLSPTLVHLYMINPIATILQQFRHAIINPLTPSASALLGGSIRLIAPIAITLGIFVMGSLFSTGPRRTWPRISDPAEGVRGP